MKAFARSRPGGASAAPAPLPDFSQFGATDEVDLSRLRRTIARNLGNSWNQIPHVTLHAHAEIDELNRQRKALQESGRHASITAILVQQVVAALQAEPVINASFDADAGKLVLKRYYNIGIAVDTERGLVVPVIRDADSKSLGQSGGRTVRPGRTRPGGQSLPGRTQRRQLHDYEPGHPRGR